jgi:hypothetical protein
MKIQDAVSQLEQEYDIGYSDRIDQMARSVAHLQD